jgi:ADP-ribose pyrophosphatase YjhB (NUDIX family)
MSHIHTEPGQHDFTASAYIVRLDTPEPSLVLHMHKKIHKYLQFGGHVELSETPWQALTHELAEESGYALEQLQILQPEIRITHLTGTDLQPQPISIQTHSFPGLDHYHTDIAYAFVTHEAPRGQIGAEESQDIRLFTLADLKALPDEETITNVRETGIFVLTTCIAAWQPMHISKLQ